MSKKSFGIIFILSVILTYGVAIIDNLLRNSLLTGGVPFRFSFIGTLLGGGSTNYLALIADILFWFIVLFIIKWLIFDRRKKAQKKKTSKR